MEKCVHWYGHILRREDGNAFRRVLDFEVEGQGGRGGSRLRKKA